MIRFVGACLLVAGSGGFGLVLASAHRREMKLVKQLLHGVQEMAWELKYRMTALPELCGIGAEAAGGPVKDVLLDLSDRLRRNEVTDIAGTMNHLLAGRELPGCVRRELRQLGMSLGRYDLEGQLQGLELLRQQCRRDLRALEEKAPQRIRNYQTLALCAGIALAILFI